MAGHSHSANIRHRKERVDARRGKAFSKHARAIMTAARLGGGDPKANPRLALAIEKARADNMPKDRIERAILKGTGELEGAEDLQEVRYEAYGPGGVAILVDALTDNRNRTTAELRHVLDKHGGRMAESGAVAWMFEARALVALQAEGVDEDALIEAAADLGADDVRREGDSFWVLGAQQELHRLAEGLRERGFSVERAEIAMMPQSTVTLDRQQAKQILSLIEALEDHDDVQATHSNLEIPDEILAELTAD